MIESILVEGEDLLYVQFIILSFILLLGLEALELLLDGILLYLDRR